MVTDYTTIAKIRSEIGHKPEKEYREDIGTGDGSTTVFELNYTGVEKMHAVVSRDMLGSPDEDDIDIFLAGSTVRESSSDYSLDVDEGTVTFNAAPADGVAVECTYWHSVISDDEISTECIAWAMDYIDLKTNQSYYTSGDTLETHTDIWDGDGVSESFKLSRGRIVTVDSYDIDGVTSGYTENSDYYLYPRQYRIAFETPPVRDRRNVQVTYQYGTPINATVQELATVMASIKAISLIIGRTGITGSTTGTGTKRSYKDSGRYITQTKLLYERADHLFKNLGLKVQVSRV